MTIIIINPKGKLHELKTYTTPERTLGELDKVDRVCKTLPKSDKSNKSGGWNKSEGLRSNTF